MSKILKSVLIILFVNQLSCTIYTWKNCNHNIKQKVLIDINTYTHNKIQNNDLIHIRIYVQTTTAAQILLSSEPTPTSANAVHEIVLGDNSQYLLENGYNKVENKDIDLFSYFKVMPIEIVLQRDGVLKVFIPGYKSEPLIQYQSNQLISVRNITFTTYANGLWYYYCDFDPNAIKNVPNESTLMADTMPLELKSIRFIPQIIGLSYAQQNSLLETQLNFVLIWQDRRLSALTNRNKHKLKSLTHSDIWTPKVVYSDYSGTEQFIRHCTNDMQTHPNNTIEMQFDNVVVKNWCSNDTLKWSNVYLRCRLQFGLGTGATNNVCLSVLDNDEQHILNSFRTQLFTSLEIVNITTQRSDRLNEYGEVQANNCDITIQFELMYSDIFYKHLFLLPIMTSCMFLLSSFMLHGWWRSNLLVLVIVLIVVDNIMLINYAPTGFTSKLSVAQQYALYMAIYCYILHILIMWLTLYPPSRPPGAYIIMMLRAGGICCMNADSYIYDNDYDELTWRDIARKLNFISGILICMLLVAIAIQFIFY